MRNAAILAIALLLALAPVGTAGAADLASAMRQGLVGERADGLVGLVSGSVSGDVRQLVDQVNRGRMQKYRQIASQRGVPVDQVQRIAAQRLIGSAPAGIYVQNPGGGWVRK